MSFLQQGDGTPAPEQPRTPDGGGVRLVKAGEGPTVWLNGDVYTVKVGVEGTHGDLAMLEASVPPGGGPPLHNHTHEDEAFYLLSGELEMYADGTDHAVRSGDFVFVPRGIYHRFRNTGHHPARLLAVFTPGGFERFFLEAGRKAHPGEPIPPFDPANGPRAKEIGERYGSFQAPDTATE
ncbi:quercetin 2,3-dioxygenase [Streptomyces catenulae]|uniref:Quercetin 2,3-dioxygenase n=1 Tax=Streptomyces catenulae TaxID=66875 RepID=A0ABV2Z1V3_9ACTN|nr:quercetin 2,3-dioxygenase [Streptomyces catenulae]